MIEEKIDKKEQNLYLWKQVQDTPKELITEYEIEDGKKLKTVAPINKMKKATEMFGVYGATWKLEKIVHSEKTIFNNLILALIDAEFVVYDEDKKTEITRFQISNSTPIVSFVDDKLKVNFSYRKALETDTISKALSRLGFNADTYTDTEILRTKTDEKDELLNADFVDIGESIDE